MNARDVRSLVSNGIGGATVTNTYSLLEYVNILNISEKGRFTGCGAFESLIF